MKITKQKPNTQIIPIETIERQIFLIRGHKVMLDVDLAELYHVETKTLNRAVKRNFDRFPKDFMFQLTTVEAKNLRFHFGTSIKTNWGGRRYLPYVFTEQGVAMLSSVLKSKRAVQANIAIMRAFVRLREIIATHKNLARKLEEMEKKYNTQFKIVFDAIRKLMQPTEPYSRKKIGFAHPQKGFIQIPLLIAIIAGVLVLVGVGYFGVGQYQNRQIINPKNENNQSTTTPELSEVDKLRQEVEELKKQSLQNKNKVSATTKDITVISTGKKSVLTNAQIIAKIKPATVYIKTQTAVGSGMIFSTDGYVLTNAHVVEDATDVDISLSTGVALTGTVTGRDEVADLAVIKINTTKQLPKVDFDDSDKVEQGDNVFTFGFPFGIEGTVSFKEGTISRRIESYFETSTEIHPGNSGGPLVNKFGQVIGVNTAVFGKSVGGVQLGETIKLAIPINVARDIIPDLEMGRNVVLPKKPKQQYVPVPIYDYSPPIITSITAERPLGASAVIVVKIKTNEESITFVSFSFKYTPEIEARDKVWSASSDSALKIFTVSVPYPSWNENTELIMSVRATDIKGNVGKTESYSVRFVSIPGTTGATYTQPFIVK